MIIKHAFLGVFQKLMVFCIAMTMFVFTAHATIPSEYVAITPDDTTQYPETLSGYTKLFIDGNVSWKSIPGSGDGLDYYQYKLYSANNVVSATVAPQISDRLINYGISSSNSGIGFNVYYSSSNSGTFIVVRDPSNFTSTSTVQTYFTNNPMTVLYKKSSNPDNNNFVAVKRVSDGALGYYCESGASAGDFVVAYGMTGTVNPCPGGTLQTYTTVASTDVPVGVQNGTPTPTNPITPTFYTQGNMVLRKVGDYADSYDATTGKITRRVGVKALNGTENWSIVSTNYSDGTHRIYTNDFGYDLNTNGISTHFVEAPLADRDLPTGQQGKMYRSIQSFHLRATQFTSLPAAKQYLASQYANGTPVTIYYPLATPTEEDWAAEQCSNAIKIATRAYNTTQFAPVVTALNTAVNTIKDVVTNTINQTAAVSALQSTKQTRPDDGCPQYRQCLLVEDSSGTPQWFVITDPFRDFITPIIATNTNGTSSIGDGGFQQLEYIEADGNQYINTNIAGSTNAVIDFQGVNRNDDIIVFVLAPVNATAYQNGFGQYQNTVNGGFSVATRRVYNVSYTSSSLTVNGVSVSGRYIANDVNLALLGSSATNNNRKISGKLYSAKIYNGPALIRDFVPARRNSDNNVGMYDLVSGNFFASATGTDFTAGADVTNVSGMPAEPNWSVTWDNNGDNVAGTIRGIGKCNSSASDATNTTAGANCWCKIVGLDLSEQNINITNGTWVHYLAYSSESGCVSACANDCAGRVKDYSEFRQSVL